MSIEKRNALASTAAMFVPLAIDELNTAARCIEEGNPTDALKWIAEAQIHLEHLRVAFDEACAEANAVVDK